MSKIAILLSGGVDSSVSAYILKKLGYDLIGIHLKVAPCSREGDKKSCCSKIHENDARKVAEKLDIPFYVINLEKEFKETVVDYFVNEYKKGRTPNPCVVCNACLRFSKLFEILKKYRVERLASGHYARIDRRDSKFYLLRGRDFNYDQSYFLYRLNRDVLKNIIFPVGELKKERVREIARKRGLGVHHKRSSQDFCFIEGDYREFLKKFIPEEEGDIVLPDGRVVGRHNGIFNFTVGQRKGIGSFGKPMYVIRIDPRKNIVVIGDKNFAYKKRIELYNLHFLSEVKKEFDCYVKVRYSHKGEKARIEILGERAIVFFENPVLSPTPGQSAVFYKDSVVLGGGIIGDNF